MARLAGITEPPKKRKPVPGVPEASLRSPLLRLRFAFALQHARNRSHRSSLSF